MKRLVQKHRIAITMTGIIIVVAGLILGLFVKNLMLGLFIIGIGVLLSIISVMYNEY